MSNIEQRGPWAPPSFMPDKAFTFQQADSVYQGFPDFADWPSPTEEDLLLWDRFASRLQETREKAMPEALRKSVEVAVRAAAMDTGAIEGLYTVDRGFTMTVATQAIAWEHALAEKGEDVRALFEAQLAAYELAMDAVTRKLPITEAWIRALHEKVCATQPTYKVLTDQGWQHQELPRGAYKTQPNHVRLTDGSIHPYAPVDRVSAEMYRLLQQIRTPAFESSHSIAQASYLHYGFVVIHPFADGNGRVARALASVFFYRALSIPFLVFANQKTAYLDALREADRGKPRPLLAFVRDRGVDTMQLVNEHLLTAASFVPEEVISRLRQRETLDDVARRLMLVIREQLEAQAGGFKLPGSIELYFPHASSRGDTSVPGYRQVDRASPPAVSLVDRSGKGVTAILDVLIAIDDRNPFAFLVETHRSPDKLEIRLEDAQPEVTESLRARISNWTRRQLASLLEELERKIQSPPSA